MRGIILAGGTGSRLSPLTRAVNKHCLPVASLPMIYHPLHVLTFNDVEDVTVVSTPQGVGQNAALLGSGRDHGCRIRYAVQDAPGGLAHAITAGWTGRDKVAVVLGDNVFDTIPQLPDLFDWDYDEEPKAVCYLKRVDDVGKLREFGVPGFAGDRICTVEEKPLNPKSHFAVCGLYVLSADVWPVLLTTPPGKRGEVEVSDVLNTLASRGELGHVEVEGFWGDAGTPDGLRECDEAMRGK